MTAVIVTRKVMLSGKARTVGERVDLEPADAFDAYLNLCARFVNPADEGPARAAFLAARDKVVRDAQRAAAWRPALSLPR